MFECISALLHTLTVWEHYKGMGDRWIFTISISLTDRLVDAVTTAATVAAAAAVAINDSISQHALVVVSHLAMGQSTGGDTGFTHFTHRLACSLRYENIDSHLVY